MPPSWLQNLALYKGSPKREIIPCPQKTICSLMKEVQQPCFMAHQDSSENREVARSGVSRGSLQHEVSMGNPIQFSTDF